MNPNIIHVTSAHAVSESATYVAESLQKWRQTYNKGFLLLAGGSAIPLYREALSKLPDGFDLSNWTVGLGDERIGPPGHPDSNELQLREAGVIQMMERLGAVFLPILSELKMTGTSLKADQVNLRYANAFASTDQSILFAGVGEDGHTLGIMTTQSSERFAQLYEHPNTFISYTVDPNDSMNQYKHRITLNPEIIQTTDTAVVYALGIKKKLALQAFVQNAVAPYQMPVMLLRRRKLSPTIVITDQEI